MGITAAKLNAGYQPASSTFNGNALPLSDVDLSSLPSALFEPPFCSVESLLCLSKGLTSIPPNIKRFTRLVSLDLGHNAIEAYPEELFLMTTLKKIRLGSNQLPALPSSVARLTRLEELHLSNNPLHSLPWTIFTLTSLTLMDLRATMLNVIPHHISHLTNLHTFNISANPINELPAGLSVLTKLEILNVSHCRMLHHVSSDLRNLRRIRHFVLSGTGIRTIPMWLIDLPRLEALAIDGTPAVTGIRPDLRQMRAKVHNSRTYNIMKVLWMLALEKTCYVRKLNGRYRDQLGAVSKIEPSYFARLPREILYMILRSVAIGHTEMAMTDADICTVYEHFLANAPLFETCTAVGVDKFAILFPQSGASDPLQPRYLLPRSPANRLDIHAIFTMRLRIIRQQVSAKTFEEIDLTEGSGKPKLPPAPPPAQEPRREWWGLRNVTPALRRMMYA